MIGMIFFLIPSQWPHNPNINLENFNVADGHFDEDHIVRPINAVGKFCERRLETLQREIILVINFHLFLQSMSQFPQDPVSKPCFENSPGRIRGWSATLKGNQGWRLLGKFPKSTEATLLPDLLSGRYLAR